MKIAKVSKSVTTLSSDMRDLSLLMKSVMTEKKMDNQENVKQIVLAYSEELLDDHHVH